MAKLRVLLGDPEEPQLFPLRFLDIDVLFLAMISGTHLDSAVKAPFRVLVGRHIYHLTTSDLLVE